MPSKTVTRWPAYPYHMQLYYSSNEMRQIERRAKHWHQDTRYEEQVIKRHARQALRNVTAAIGKKGKTG